MTIIDFHNHFYPPQYIEALQSGPSNIKVSFDSENNPLLHYPGDYNIIVREHTDINFRAEVLKEARVDKQILTFTTPGTHIEPPERSVELARMVNDSFAKIMDEHQDHFTALATLPLNDPQGSVVELERAFNDLGFRGVMVYSNINGTALSDQSFWPLYKKANDLNAVFYIHPSFPVGVEAMTDYWLMPLVGFTFDTTLAAAKLVFSGVAEKFPQIRWVLAHLGGAIPYLAERLDRGYFAFKDCREHINKPPSEYLKDFYYDTVNFDLKALQLAVDFAGADHLVAGSDYPHQIGSLEKMVDSIEKLNISSKDKEAVYGANASKLLEIIP
ncbi:MAG: amidohydrolase family protein [Desulfatiglandales bacterium]